ncbi:sugar ABC transporter permease [Tessaracoccus sp. OS52]|uniref:carbohydrate ABC transporter permease n=1 Tax=Tessaracoccus sp. OS52 TaxID=2886691 RepID=UPI001D122290|nr:sugar ABC transporter permease [Tessaracoccus sp. OS52]MCC2591885.1 sugar ABC transporter permease [Tessaracoccus sp. OS52]
MSATTTSAVDGAGASAPGRRRRGWRERDKLWGVFFVAPQTLGLLLFTLIPFGFAFVLAFTEWSGFGMPEFVGFDNFANQLSSPLLGRAIGNTLVIAAVTVPVGLFLAILVASVLNKIKGRAIYMVMFFAPVVTSSVAVALIWQQLLRADGVLSGGLTTLFGIPPIDWLGDPVLALLAVCAVTIWSSLGLNVVIFMAGLQNISPSVMEAAAIDGAGPIARFFKLTLPLLSPIIFFQSVIAFISSLQTFDLVFVLVANAGPDNGTRTIVYHIYDLGIAKLQLGLSSAASIILLVLTLAITAVQFGLQKKFVHYEG